MQKLTGRQTDILREATRLHLKFNRINKPLTEYGAGLGDETHYKPVLDAGLMEFNGWFMSPHRGWLVLTEKGAAIVQKWLDDGLTLDDLESGTLYSLVGYRG